MSNLEGDSHSLEGVTMGSDDIESCIEECRSFIQKSKNLVRCPEDTSAASNQEIAPECLVDTLTEKEVNEIRRKVFSYWETTKTQQKYGGGVETSKANILQDCEPSTQSEETVTSFEDAKSEVAPASKRLEPDYDIEQLIEAELRDIRNSRFSEDYSFSSTETMREAKLSTIESMDFTGIEEKAADLPGIAGVELRQRTLPVLSRTDVLEVLLRIYECLSVDFAERSTTYLVKSEIGDLSTHSIREEFRKYLVVEMKIIYGRLVSICSSGIHRAPENADTSNSSSSTKDSSSSKLVSPAIPPTSPLELSTSAYPEPTARSQAEDNTISNLSFSTMDSDNSSPSGLINVPVLDMAAAQPKSSTSSSGESVNNTNTSSMSASEEDNNTLSGISSLPTDPRTSVSSLRDIDVRTSMSSLKDVYPKTSVSSSRDVDNRTSVSSLKDIESFDVMSSNIPPQQGLSLLEVNPRASGSSSKDIYPRTSASSLRDVEIRTTVSSLKDIDSNVLPQQLLSEEDISDDAFLTAPLIATTEAVPSMMDSTETAQNPRRRERSSKEDEDKNEAKRQAL